MTHWRHWSLGEIIFNLFKLTFLKNIYLILRWLCQKIQTRLKKITAFTVEISKFGTERVLFWACANARANTPKQHQINLTYKSANQIPFNLFLPLLFWWGVTHTLHRAWVCRHCNTLWGRVRVLFEGLQFGKWNDVRGFGTVPNSALCRSTIVVEAWGFGVEQFPPLIFSAGFDTNSCRCIPYTLPCQ